MSRHHLVLALIVGWGLLVPAAWGQAMRDGDDLPDSIKTSAAPTTQQVKIEEFVQKQVKRLAGTDTKDQAKARDVLCRNAAVSAAAPSGTVANAEFLDLYARLLNTALLPLAGDPRMLVRLNTAIVAEHVAERADNVRLKDLVIKLMQDKCEAVVLWGVKGAKFVVPAIVRQGAALATDPLLAELVPAVKRVKATRGAIIQEAYAAVVLKTNIRDAAMIQAVLPRVHELMQIRIEQYAAGVPDEPSAEEAPLLFLTREMVWAVQTPEQRTQSMQRISDLVALAGQQAATRKDKESLVALIRYAGSAVLVVRDTVKNADQKTALQNAATAANKLDAARPAEVIAQTCTDLTDAIRGAAEFKGVGAPPKIAPPPASATTTPEED